MFSQPFQRTSTNESDDNKQGRKNQRPGYLFLNPPPSVIAFLAVGYQFSNELMLLGVRLRVNPERVAAFFHFMDDGLGELVWIHHVFAGHVTSQR